MAKAQNNNNSAFSLENARVFAGTPVLWVADALYGLGDLAMNVAEFIGGEGIKEMPGYNFAAAHKAVTDLDLSMAPEVKNAVKMGKEAMEESKHSDMVQKKGHRWVASPKAVDAAKKSGHDKALIPHLYSAANWIAACAEEGAEKVYSAANGTAHTYAGWVFTAIRKHAGFLAAKGVKNADTPEALEKYFESACKHAAALTDKTLPTWEQVCEFVQKEGVAAKADPAPAAETAQPAESAQSESDLVVEVVEEPRDGRAPKTAVAKGVNEAIHSLGFPRLTKKAAFEIAQKAAEAAENGVIDESMRNTIIEACATKDGGDPEEYFALMES